MPPCSCSRECCSSAFAWRQICLTRAKDHRHLRCDLAGTWICGLSSVPFWHTAHVPCPAACNPIRPCPAAASCMGLTAAVHTDAADWHFPQSMVLPLLYWIVVCSVGGYYAVTWAMRHLPASQVSWARLFGGGLLLLCSPCTQSFALCVLAEHGQGAPQSQRICVLSCGGGRRGLGCQRRAPSPLGCRWQPSSACSPSSGPYSPSSCSTRPPLPGIWGLLASWQAWCSCQQTGEIWIHRWVLRRALGGTSHGACLPAHPRAHSPPCMCGAHMITVGSCTLQALLARIKRMLTQRTLGLSKSVSMSRLPAWPSEQPRLS